VANSNQTSKRTVFSKPGFATAALAALLFVASCSSWFSEDKKSNLDGECVGKDYVELNELITAPYQNCTTSSECPSGSYCESDSDVHHTTATGAICYWQCYADSDCGFGNHCDCNGQCAELDQDAGPGGDPSCPRNEALLATLETGVHYLSQGAASEWPLQETVEPLSDSTGSGCSFTNLTTSGELGVLGAQAVDLDGRLAWEAIDNADWGGPESYLECNESTTLDLDLNGFSKAVRVVFRIPSGTSVEQGMTLIGKRDGGDGTGAGQGSGWNITFENSGQLNVFLYDGSGIVDDWAGAPINGPWPGYIALTGGNYNDGNWHYVEMVVDTSDAMSPQLRARTDLDAGQASTLDPTWNLSTAAPLRVGAYPGDGTGIPDNIQYTYVAGFSGVDAEALINLTTPDNGWWEAAVATDGRSCLYNEDCPYGSKCSDDTKTCAFSCIDTNHPVQGCTGGTVCDCFGDCVEPGAVALRRSDDMPFMEVMPREIPVSNETFAARRVSLNLVTEVPAVAVASAAVPVTIAVLDNADLEVSCGATEGTGGYSSSCTIDSWTFETHGPRRRAAGVFWVRGVPGNTSEETSWTLRLSSGGTAKHLEYVTIREFDASLIVSQTYSQPGVYNGVLSRVALGSLVDGLSLETLPLEVPVQAWATLTTIDIFDKSKTISPSGWLRIDTTADLQQELLVIPETGLGAPLATGDASGLITGSSIIRTFDADVGALSGEFEMIVVGDTRWQFALSRSGDTNTCAALEECASDEACSNGLCVPFPGWSPGAWVAVPILKSNRAERWAESAAELFAQAVLLKGAYDREQGIARDTPETVESRVGLTLANRLPSAFRGADLAEGFVEYLGWLSGIYYSGVEFSAALLDHNGSVLCGAQSGCDSMSGASALYTTPTGFFQSWSIHDNYAPCHSRSPDSGSINVFSDVMTTLPYQQQLTTRGTCEELHANLVAGGATVETTATSFISTNCHITGNKLVVDAVATNGSTTASSSHTIYLCPFKAALLGGNGAEYREQGERALCYKPTSSGAELLRSESLGTQVQQSSGDLKCAGGSMPSGVKIANYLDRQSEGNEGLASGDMLAECLTDLSIEPPDTVVLTPANALEQLQGFFSEQTCFDPGTFYTTLAELTGTLEFAPPWNPIGGWGVETQGPDVQRLLTRVLQQWTELHTFIATEGKAVVSMAEGLRHRTDLGLEEGEAVDKAPTYEQLLDEAEHGWQLLLSFQDVVANFRDEDALLNPDYRPTALQTSSLEHEQNIGLPVFVMEGLAAHMMLVNAYLETTRVSAYADCYGGTLGTRGASALERSQRAVHYSNLVSEVWGTTVAAVKKQIPSTPIPWQERWDAAELEFQASRSAVLRSITKLQECALPSFDSGAVPLYFGDAQGTSARYFAASDYILSGWAVPAVQTAISALDSARAAFISKRNSQLQDQQTQSDADFRLAELKASWGKGIVDFCGLTGISPEAAIARVSLRDSQLSFPGRDLFLDSCYIDKENPICVPEELVVYPPESYPVPPDGRNIDTESQIRYELCFEAHVNDHLDLLFSDPQSQAIWVDLEKLLRSDVSGTRLPYALENWLSVSIDPHPNGGWRLDQSPNPMYSGHYATVRELIYLLVTRAHSMEDAMRLVSQAESECTSHPEFAGTSYSNENTGPELPDALREQNAACLRGTMGATVAQLIAQSTSIDIAEQRFLEQKSNYKSIADVCKTHLGNASVLEDLRTAHNNHIGNLQKVGAGIGIASSLIKSVALSTVPGGQGASLSHGLDAFSGIGTAHIQSQISAANAEWEKMVALRHAQEEYESCMVPAELIINGLKTWELQATEAIQQFDAALIQLENQKREAINLVHQARASIAREDGRQSSRYSHHYWLDEAIDSFHRDFEHAQYLTLMALRAVEFEFQQSIALQDDILGAKTPEELQDSIILLRQEQFTRTLNSRRPEESQLVLSLRDQIMGLGQNQSSEPGERDWTPFESFRDRVMAGSNAVFNDYGTYLGQGITFDLLPTGALEHRCGERLWALTATLQGDLLDVEAPSTSLFVIRNNSFSSQWCDGHEQDGQELQVASMQPTSGLFQREDQGGSESFGLSKITAMLQPWFNVPRSEFYKEQYSEGSSEEFAGRGLYGEYTILFPEAGLLEDGFPLERVEDILIRFDYISVDNLTNL
jgi:hypothetical protein